MISMTITRTCSLDGCERPHKGLGYCRVHLDRVKRTGAPGPAVVRVYGAASCTVAGCVDAHSAQGLCERHYARLRKHGDPLHYVERVGPHAPNWKAEGVGYSAAHYRVKAVRGAAREHDCACGATASEWAYNHSDPDEITTTQNGYEVRYSLDPTRYVPMCRNCHRKLDHDNAKARA
jgi:hypothetical protein